MSETIFDSPDQGQQPQEPVVQPQVPQALQELVGEGRKYATVEQAVASIPHAQSHISKLESELTQLREELGKRQTTQQILDDFKSNMQPSPGMTTPKEVSQDEIAKLVEQIVTQNEVKKQAEYNSKSVVNKFVELYGQDKAKEQFVKLSQETGLPLSELNRLASTSPSAFFKLAGIGTTTSATPAKIGSDVTTPPSSAVPVSSAVAGNSSKDLLDAWKRAGEKVRQNYS